MGLGTTIIGQVYAPVTHGQSTPIDLSGYHENNGCHNPCSDHLKPGQVCPMYCFPE